MIATGTRAVLPPIPGLGDAGALTHEDLFELTERPARLAVIGAGPIGCEMAQSFQRFGTRVTLLESESQILPRDDADAARIVENALRAEGVRVCLDARIEAVTRSGNEKHLEFVADDRGERFGVDEILVAAGRTPNVEELGLAVAGVELDSSGGVHVNDRLQTTNRSIFAAGDVCLDAKFTHVAEASARAVVQNALFFGRKRASAWVVPWATYTDPELAQVGLSEAEAARRGISISTFEMPMAEIDRSLLAGDETGFLKIHLQPGSDRILGATIVSRHAGELVSQISLAMQAKLGLSRLSDVIYPYPTTAEAIKRTAGAYLRTRLTPGVARLLGTWLRWRR